MQCRRIMRTNDGVRHIVWFGSYGKNADGTAKFFNVDDKHDNYSDERDAVADSLTQRLNVIRGELWYSMKSGLPLTEKQRDKGIVDAAIIDIILSHPDVSKILSYESVVDKDTNIYSIDIKILSTYGELELTTGITS